MAYVVLDGEQHEARRVGQAIVLTPREFTLLLYLTRNAGRVLSKERIAEHVWGYDARPTSVVRRPVLRVVSPGYSILRTLPSGPR